MELRNILKTSLKSKYQKLNEAYSANSLLPLRLCYRRLRFDYIFHDLLQHEFRYVENSERIALKDAPLTAVLSCDCKHNNSERTVITLGVSGVGKTTMVQSCALEWAKGTGYHHIHLLFPLAFWELNLIKRKLNVIELLQIFYPGLKDSDASSLNRSNVWFILDGLDEFRHPLKFNHPTVSHVSEVSTVDVLVTSLIKGTLLPNAHIWITTRYKAAAQIPHSHLLKETAIQGFSDEQKEKAFRAVISNEDLAGKALDHVKISTTLNFLCQIPPICIIMANVFKSHLKEEQGFKFSPLNLTQIYTHLIKASDSKMIAKLKRLAQRRLTEENVLMYEDDLLKGDISAEEASAFSEKCPLVLIEEKGLNNTSVFRFSQLSIQEFLAASATIDCIEKQSSRAMFCRVMLKESVLSEQGKTEIFLRFIFGLINVRQMLKPTDEFFDHAKKTMLQNIPSYSSVGLIRCLLEHDRQALRAEVQFFLRFGTCALKLFTPSHWCFVIKRVWGIDAVQPNFAMQVSTSCDEKVMRQLPAIMKSRKAKLRFSNLTDKCCPALAVVLSTTESYLRELDLGYNSISDSGVRTLAEVLEDENCYLEVLRLQGCEVTSEGCKYLARALRVSSTLHQLDLSRNEIGDEGIKHLSNGLESSDCRLESLKLSQCNIEWKGCRYLASALQKNSGFLKVLDLSINMVGDKGGNEIFKKFDISQLRKLEMYHCGITVSSCERIAEALKNEDSSLVELNLSNNRLKDAGFDLICQGMYAWCSLEKLNISRCGITGIGCTGLAKILCSVSQLYSGWMPKTDWQAIELTDLDLSMNFLGDNGVKEISPGLKNPYTHLKTLNLSHCGLTEDCCEELAAEFSARESLISELDLSENVLQDRGVRRLCVGIRNPQCILQKLSLQTCGLTSKSIQFLISAMKSNPKYLGELHLMGNRLDNSGIRGLMELTKNHKYALHIIDVTTD